MTSMLGPGGSSPVFLCASKPQCFPGETAHAHSTRRRAASPFHRWRNRGTESVEGLARQTELSWTAYFSAHLILRG